MRQPDGKRRVSDGSFANSANFLSHSDGQPLRIRMGERERDNSDLVSFTKNHGFITEAALGEPLLPFLNAERGSESALVPSSNSVHAPSSRFGKV